MELGVKMRCVLQRIWMVLHYRPVSWVPAAALARFTRKKYDLALPRFLKQFPEGFDISMFCEQHLSHAASAFSILRLTKTRLC